MKKYFPNTLKFTLFLGIFNCFFSEKNFSQADWKLITAPHARDLKDVFVFNASSFMVVGGHETNDSILSLFKTNDGGQNWSLYVDLLSEPWLQTIRFANPSIGFAAGYSGTFFKTTNGGNSWIPLPLPGYWANRNYLSAFFIDPLTGFLAGGTQSPDSTQTILKTTDGGLTWSEQLDQLGPCLKEIYFINSSTGFAVGEDGAILKTINGGDLWFSLNVPFTVNQRDFNSVYFFNSDTGIVAGGRKQSGSMQTILNTYDGGNSWNIIKDSPGPWLNKVSFHSPSAGFAVGDSGTILLTTDKGNSWNLLNLPDTINDFNNLNSVHFINPDFGIMVGNFGKILIYKSPNLPIPEVQLQPLVGVSPEKITMYGLVNPNNIQENTLVEFEYGTTPAMGNLLTSIPTNFMGLSDIPVSASIFNFIPNSTYYYRLKVTNSSGIFYSSTGTFYSGFEFLFNWDFELWDSINFQRPDDWSWEGNIEKVPSFDGGTALKLSADSSNFLDRPGVIFYGSPEEKNDFLTITGGVPFSEKPDSVSAYLNFSIEPGDSAILFCAFKSNGNLLSFNLNYITGSSGGNFVPLSFPINYSSPGIPDSVIIEVTNSSPFSNSEPNSSTLYIDKISFPGSFQNLPNSDFENWSTISYENPSSWNILELDGLKKYPVQFPFSKTSNSFSGDFGLQIENDNANPNFPESIVLLLKQKEDFPEKPSFPVFHRPFSLNGYYKYLPSSGDTFSINITFFTNGALIGSGFFFADSAASEFTPFSAPIYYTDSTNPDSAYIRISSAAKINSGNSKLTLDALSFDGFVFSDTSKNSISESFEENSLPVTLKIFPNPASDFISIEIINVKSEAQLILTNLQGEIISFIPIHCLSCSGKENFSLNTGGLSRGLYFLKYMDNQSRVTGKFLVQH